VGWYLSRSCATCATSWKKEDICIICMSTMPLLKNYQTENNVRINSTTASIKMWAIMSL
jgi:hypothetical protein